MKKKFQNFPLCHQAIRVAEHLLLTSASWSQSGQGLAPQGRAWRSGARPRASWLKEQCSWERGHLLRVYLSCSFTVPIPELHALPMCSHSPFWRIFKSTEKLEEREMRTYILPLHLDSHMDILPHLPYPVYTHVFWPFGKLELISYFTPNDTVLSPT